MNERIQELIKQAMVLDDDELFVREVFDREKFAELLIRKCAMKANATALDLRNYPELDGRKYVGDCILKCFEVES
jgi:hypothetical protein